MPDRSHRRSDGRFGLLLASFMMLGVIMTALASRIRQPVAVET